MKSQTAREIIIAALGAALGAVLGFVSSPFLREIWDYAADTVLPQLSPRARLSLVATLAIICLVLLVWVWVLESRRLLMRKFEPDKIWLGAYKNKKSGEMICGICLGKDGKVIPLTDLGGDFKCGACGESILRKESPPLGAQFG